jgi:D-alanyl-D-alanine carboxypeptidase
VTGKSFASALRTLIGYEKIGLSSIWLETLEDEPSGIPDRAHQYEGDFDTYSIDPSIDLYGGGGLVSTMGDLAKFMQATFTGRVFAKPETLETMLSTFPANNEEPAPPEKPTNGTYCMGIEIAEVNGVTVYVNYGYWGTMAAYIPSLDLSFGATVNQSEGIRKSLKSILHGTLKLAGKTIIQGS